MNFKFLPFLLLFLFNYISTAVVDFSHFDLTVTETHQVKTEKTSDHDHPANHEHDHCHENHIHYYTLTPTLKYIEPSIVSTLEFPRFEEQILTSVLDIVKPPLV